MKQIFFILTALVIYGLIMVQCSDKAADVAPPDNQPPVTPSEITAADKSLASSGNVFGMNLFREILSESGSENVFISPLSVTLALTMIYNGADGTTKEAMHTTLGYQDMTPEEVNQSCRNLVSILTTIDPTVTFTVANSIWYRLNLAVEQDFINLCATYCNAEVNAIDFGAPGAADLINQWVSANTNGKITEIIDDDTARMLVMALLNAIYFKGSWSDKFDPDDTRTAPFMVDEQTPVECEMMIKEGLFDHYWNYDYEAVRLPYGNDSAFNMVVVLPTGGSDIVEFAKDFDLDDWKTILSNLGPYDCVLGLPKFKIKWEKSLVGALCALGMSEAFRAANFDNIASGAGLALSDVVHKTYIEVNEEGTEAAAVTGGWIVTTTPPMIYFDRPFLVFIYEKNSGAIIFAGRVMNPSKDS
jgi:serpin B